MKTITTHDYIVSRDDDGSLKLWYLEDCTPEYIDEYIDSIKKINGVWSSLNITYISYHDMVYEMLGFSYHGIRKGRKKKIRKTVWIGCV